MNIQSITQLTSFRGCTNQPTKTPQQTSSTHGTKTAPVHSLLDADCDVFVRMRQIAQEKPKIYSQIRKTNSMPAGRTRLKRRVANIENLENFRKSCAATNKMFDDYNGIRYTHDQKALALYLDKMRRINRNRGLNRVFGYDDIKQELYRDFVVNVMAKDKTSQQANVPNAFLFYGPTGCGKTFFAQALAEHTLSKVKVINATDASPKKTLKNIKTLAQESLRNYEESAHDKQRTIIIVNEADFMAYPNSEIIEEFKSFISDCAKKYKCTLFLTTNYPLDLDGSLLKGDTISHKIGIPCPDKAMAEKIIRDKIAFYSKAQIGCKDLLNELFKSSEERYSTKQIDMMLERTIKNISDPDEQDYIETLRKYIPNPSVSSQAIKEYKEQKNVLDSME